MELDTFTIIYISIIAILILLSTIFGIWYWKFGRKLIQN